MSETPISPIQAMVNGLGAAWQKERAESDQWTLGELIAWLEAKPQDAEVHGLGELMSYRGYYCDLAFDPSGISRTVADVLTECRKAMGATFEGYKGGDFLMGGTTPLWVANYGCCGDRIVGMTPDAPFRPFLSPDIMDA